MVQQPLGDRKGNRGGLPNVNYLRELLPQLERRSNCRTQKHTADQKDRDGRPSPRVETRSVVPGPKTLARRSQFFDEQHVNELIRSDQVGLTQKP